MTIPTTPLKLPLQIQPLDTNGNWAPAWIQAFQYLFNRVGSYTAPSNLQLASAIGLQVTGPASAVDSDIAVFNGVTGKLIKDGGKKVADLAPIASPTFTGIPAAPTATAGTSNTQIATTGFVAGAVSGFGSVVGPASSVNSDIALFNGVTGKLIKDSGVLLSSLATLAAPAFTGIPTAPTATSGTNTTQIATTAFTAAAVSAAVPTGASFSAHNNGVGQAIPNNAFTKLALSTTQYNNGAAFATGRWTPPAKLVVITAACFIPTGTNTQTTISIYKNGADFKRGTQLISSLA
jgi:hypothetical protein